MNNKDKKFILNLDEDNNSKKYLNKVDYLNEQKQANEQFNKIKEYNKDEQNNYSFQNIAKNLNDAVSKLKRSKPQKKVYQLFLTNEVMNTINVFMRANKINKKTDAVEMLLRLALGMKQL